MDLKQFDVVSAAEEGATLMLRDPVTGNALDATITVVGSDSERYRSAQSEEQMKLLRRKQTGEKVDADEWREQASRILSRATIGWTNVTEGEKELECNERNARYIYSTYPWVREQVDKFINERSNFLSPSPNGL